MTKYYYVNNKLYEFKLNLLMNIMKKITTFIINKNNKNNKNEKNELMTKKDITNFLNKLK